MAGNGRLALLILLYDDYDELESWNASEAYGIWEQESRVVATHSMEFLDDAAASFLTAKIVNVQL